MDSLRGREVKGIDLAIRVVLQFKVQVRAGRVVIRPDVSDQVALGCCLAAAYYKEEQYKQSACDRRPIELVNATMS